MEYLWAEQNTWLLHKWHSQQSEGAFWGLLLIDSEGSGFGFGGCFQRWVVSQDLIHLTLSIPKHCIFASGSNMSRWKCWIVRSASSDISNAEIQKISCCLKVWRNPRPRSTEGERSIKCQSTNSHANTFERLEDQPAARNDYAISKLGCVSFKECPPSPQFLCNSVTKESHVTGKASSLDQALAFSSAEGKLWREVWIFDVWMMNFEFSMDDEHWWTT